MISSFRNRLAAAFVGVGLIATASYGQEIRADKADKAEKMAKAEYKNRSFCSNNNWSSNDKVSFADLREMTMPSSGSITVDGRQNGGIHVKGEERSDVLIRACVQAWGISEEAAKSLAASVRVGTGGTIKAEGPESEKGWSVSYQILAPRNSNLNLKAVNGGIHISGIEGNAEFETMNGGLHLGDLAGNVRGRTTNGGVHVSLTGTSWRGTGLDLQTTNGGVHVIMPQNYSARVETGTVNGGFHSKVAGLQVEKSTDDNGYYKHRAKKLTADLNGGGAPVRFVTTNGGVHINTPDNE